MRLGCPRTVVRAGRTLPPSFPCAIIHHMGIAIAESRPLLPGTTGWTVDDLLDPAVDAEWEDGDFEIIEGALVNMPPAYYDGSRTMSRLIRQVERYLDKRELPGEFSVEVDLVLSKTRVVKCDAV